MADFLSDAWFVAVNERLTQAAPTLGSSAARSSRKAPKGLTLPIVVAIELSDHLGVATDPDETEPNEAQPGIAGVRSWHLRIDEDGARMAPGVPEDLRPTITIFTDTATSRALASSKTNAQRSIDTGRLRVRGDLNALAAMTSVIEQLGTIPIDVTHTSTSETGSRK